VRSRSRIMWPHDGTFNRCLREIQIFLSKLITEEKILIYDQETNYITMIQAKSWDSFAKV